LKKPVIRRVLAVPPGKAYADDLLIERLPIGEENLGHRASVAIYVNWPHPDDSAQGKVACILSSPISERLEPLRSVNTVEPDLYSRTAVEDLKGVSICDARNFAVPLRLRGNERNQNGTETERNKYRNATGSTIWATHES
jgi:hypothetical protein